MTKREMLNEMEEYNWGHDLSIDSSYDEVLEEYNIFKEEMEDESYLFPNGRDYDAEDEDGPF